MHFTNDGTYLWLFVMICQIQMTFSFRVLYSGPFLVNRIYFGLCAKGYLGNALLMIFQKMKCGNELGLCFCCKLKRNLDAEKHRAVNAGKQCR